MYIHAILMVFVHKIMNGMPDILIVCYKSYLKFTNNVVLFLQTAIDLASFTLLTLAYN